MYNAALMIHDKMQFSVWRTAVVLVLAFPGLVQAQQVPDMFSCIVPARITPRTLEYRSGEFIDHWTIAPVTVGDRRLVRGTRRRMRDAELTAELTVDFEARSLAPVSLRIRSASGMLTTELVVQEGQAIGHVGNIPVSDSTGGKPMLLGDQIDNILAGAVDWERCAALTVNSASLAGGPEIVSYTRVGERVMAVSGREVLVFEVLRQRGEAKMRLFVTKSPPFVVAKKEHPRFWDLSSELVALPR